MEVIWSKDSPCPSRLCQMSKIVFVWVRSFSSSSCSFYSSSFSIINQRNQAAWRYQSAFAKLQPSRARLTVLFFSWATNQKKDWDQSKAIFFASKARFISAQSTKHQAVCSKLIIHHCWCWMLTSLTSKNKCRERKICTNFASVVHGMAWLGMS